MPAATTTSLALGDAGGEFGLAWLDLSTGDVDAPAGRGGDARRRAGARSIPARSWCPSACFSAPTSSSCSATGRPRSRRSPTAASTARPGGGGSMALLRRRHARRVRQLRPRRAGGGRARSSTMSRRRSAASCRSSPRRASCGRRGHGDRCRDAAQPRAGRRRSAASGAAACWPSIDRTVTGAGARLLAEHLSAPLTDPEAIGARLDMVAVLRWPTNGCARICARCCATAPTSSGRCRGSALGRGGPRDLAALRDTLGEVPGLRRRLGGPGEACRPPPDLAVAASRDLGEHGALVDRPRPAPSRRICRC